jgi:hypothetical protein
MSASDLIKQLERGIVELAEQERLTQSEEMAGMLLAIEDSDARHAFTRQISNFGEVNSLRLSDAILDKCWYRPALQWQDWLALLQLPIVEGLSKASAHFGSLVKKLWSQVVAAEPPDESALSSALGALARLVGVIGYDDSPLGEKISEALGIVPADEASARRQDDLLSLAASFHEAGLVDPHHYAAQVLTSFSEALRQPIEPQGPEDLLASHLVRWTLRLAQDASDEARDNLGTAVQESPWFPSPNKETLILASHLGSGEVESPFSPTEIQQLVAQHVSQFSLGLATWISSFHSTAQEVGLALRPLAQTDLPSAVSQALSDRGFTPEERAELLLPALDDLLQVPPDERFCKALGISEADPAITVDRLIDLYGEAGSNPQRESILEVWKWLNLPDKAPERKRLIVDVAIPMAHQNKQALDLVLKYLQLCVPPPRGTKGLLQKTLRERARGKDQEKRVDRAMLDADLTRRTGFLGRGREDTPDD